LLDEIGVETLISIQEQFHAIFICKKTFFDMLVFTSKVEKLKANTFFDFFACISKNFIIFAAWNLLGKYFIIRIITLIFSIR